jgi:hypothetical protein
MCPHPEERAFARVSKAGASWFETAPAPFHHEGKRASLDEKGSP